MTRGGKIFEDIAHDELLWSSPFSINEVDDFQVSFPMDQATQGSTEWYRPTILNNFMRFARILVTTQNDASILVVIADPVYPEFEVQNKTSIDLEIA
jgi:hypothetical protein